MQRNHIIALAVRAVGRALILPAVLVTAGGIALSALVFVGQTDIPSERWNDTGEGNSLVGLAPIHKAAAVALYQAGMMRLSRDSQPRMILAESDLCTQSPIESSILAAEIYARPAWRRNLEISVAMAVRSVTGRYPDWSYGIGQIRFSTARETIRKINANAALALGLRPYVAPDDDTLFALLSEPCSNAQMVSAVIAADASAGDTAADVARKYRGGREYPTIASVISYEALVATIHDDLLRTGGDLNGLLGSQTSAFRAATADQEEEGLIDVQVEMTELPTNEAALAPLACLRAEVDEIASRTEWWLVLYLPEADQPEQIEESGDIVIPDWSDELEEVSDVRLATAIAALNPHETDLLLLANLETGSAEKEGFDRLTMAGRALMELRPLDIDQFRNVSLAAVNSPHHAELQDMAAATDCTGYLIAVHRDLGAYHAALLGDS
jgi:hypothetical protein